MCVWTISFAVSAAYRTSLVDDARAKLLALRRPCARSRVLDFHDWQGLATVSYWNRPFPAAASSPGRPERGRQAILLGVRRAGYGGIPTRYGGIPDTAGGDTAGDTAGYGGIWRDMAG